MAICDVRVQFYVIFTDYIGIVSRINPGIIFTFLFLYCIDVA